MSITDRAFVNVARTGRERRCAAEAGKRTDGKTGIEDNNEAKCAIGARMSRRAKPKPPSRMGRAS
jgi:hypothetical protein